MGALVCIKKTRCYPRNPVILGGKGSGFSFASGGPRSVKSRWPYGLYGFLSISDHAPGDLKVSPQSNKDRFLGQGHQAGKRPGIDLDQGVVQDMLSGIIVGQEEEDLFQNPVAPQVARLDVAFLPFAFDYEITVFDKLGIVLD